MTARDLLETGRKDVMTRLAGQPRLQAELLQGIATIQAKMGEFVSADSTYRDLVRIYVELGQPRAAVLAAASHAENALRMRDLILATELIAAARRMPNGSGNDAEVNARLNEVEGWVAKDRGQVNEARELLVQSQREYAALRGADDLRTFTVSRKLALTERALRNFDGAVALYEALAQTAPRVKGLDDSERAEFDWEWIDLLYSAGAYSRALAEVEVAEPRCARSIGADAEGCRLLLLRAGVILLRLGWFDRAAAALPRIEAIARDGQSPYVQTEALLLGLRLESVASGKSDTPALFADVQSFGESSGAVTIKPIFKAAALLALAESRLRSGDPVGAQGWAQQAIDLVPGGPTAAIGRSLLGVSLLHQGKAALAIEQMQLGASIFESSLGADHPMTQLFALNQVLALERLGKHTEALRMVDRVQPILQRSLGRDAPTYLRVLGLRTRLELVLSSRASRTQPTQGMIEFFS